jgi:hypothetical protein
MNSNVPTRIESEFQASQPVTMTTARRATLHPIWAFTVCIALPFAAIAAAQVMQDPGVFPGSDDPSFRPHHRASPPLNQATPPPGSSMSTQPPTAQQRQNVSLAASSNPAPSPELPPSLLDQPPQPAQVDLSAGKLTIHADNSSLTAILHQLSTSAGMTVDGLNKDQRIFGTYGPGDPREILSSLLEGTGYNVMMLGNTSDGTPSQLTLSARGAALPAGQSAAPMPNMMRQNQEDDEEPTTTQYDDPPAPPANPQPGAPNGGIRTPQQMLQELQQMRQQQQQQQQQPQ